MNMASFAARSLIVTASLAVACLAPAHADTQDRKAFVPHRAVFDLQTLPAASRKTFTQVSGRFVYDYNRTCFGETYNHQMKMRLTAVSGQSIETDSRVSAFEPADGLSLQFSLREWLNGRPFSHFEGKASRDKPGAEGQIDYDKIEGAQEAPPTELSGKTLFPMQHSTELLRAAAQGKKRLSSHIFDGDSLSIVDAIIASPGADVPPSIPDRMKDDIKRHKLLLAFFDPNKPDAAPHYQTKMVLWANGVTSSFTMETEDIAVVATLTKLEFTPSPECD